MKNKRKDELLTAALDGTQDRTAWTQEERSEIEALQQMKAGLRGLKEVPACQISNERLRDAILDRGVKRTGSYGLAALGAAVACALFALVLVNNDGIENNVPVAKEDSSNRVAMVTEPTEKPIATNEFPMANTPEPDVALAQEPSGVRKPLAKRAPRLVLKPSQPVAMIAVSMPNKTDEMRLESASYNSEAPVVIVDSERQTEVGAASAVELEAYGDVVFGG